jgi:plasmid stabilization system protein ParE
VNVSYTPRAREDAAQQFRYYLLEADSPTIAVRFQDAFEHTIEVLRRYPHAGSRYPHSRYKELRSSPIVGFEMIRVYYVTEDESIQIVRVLDGKRNVARILEE